jgi:hypothetical protein
LKEDEKGKSKIEAKAVAKSEERKFECEILATFCLF